MIDGTDDDLLVGCRALVFITGLVGGATFLLVAEKRIKKFCKRGQRGKKKDKKVTKKGTYEVLHSCLYSVLKRQNKCKIFL